MFASATKTRSPRVPGTGRSMGVRLRNNLEVNHIRHSKESAGVLRFFITGVRVRRRPSPREWDVDATTPDVVLQIARVGLDILAGDAD